MEPSELISGRYRLEEPIGRGGMATIFRAVDEHMMDRLVAVKVLREVYSSDPKFVTRFQREARAASALQHPNIVQVFDYGQSGDSYYIVMEYIDGMDLRRYLKRRGVLPIERAVQIARDVSLGLGAAHKRGIVHRDVKPQNIMLNEDGLVKLTDFGIASMYKDADAERLTTTGMTLGTVQYYAPEQAQGEIVRPSADIYALGIVMYEMLTGQTPFEGDTPVAVAMKHIQETPVPPSSINPRIPPSLERIILRCLEKDPQARFRDGEALAAALDNFLRAPSRRPGGVASGVNDVGGPYGSSGPVSPRAGIPSGPRPGVYPGGPAPTSGPRNPGARSPLSVNGRQGMSMGGYGDEPMTDTYDQRGYDGMVMAPPVPTSPSRGVGAPGQTQPRWPGAQPPGPPRRNGALIGMTIAAALILLVVGCFLAYTVAGANLNLFGSATPTVTPVPSISVPNIVGMTCTDAEAALTKIKLKINCVSATSNQPAGQIISQNPTSGQTLKAGQVVQAQISAGQQKVTIPTFTNKNSGEACATITGDGLNCNIQTVNSNSIGYGYVIKSDPPAGTKVDPGTTVTIFVSIGPQATATPTNTATPTAVATCTGTVTATPCP